MASQILCDVRRIMLQARDASPLNDPNAALHRCEWEDLAVVVTAPNAIGHVEYFDVGREWIDPKRGKTIQCIGYPIDIGVLNHVSTVGNNELRYVTLSPNSFTGVVLPAKDDYRFLKDFAPSRHYLVSFEDAASGRRPNGFSGGGMFVEGNEKQIVWTATFKFGGICLASYKKGRVLMVLKASIVRRYLEEILGPPA
jgi:hypothetical protein